MVASRAVGSDPKILENKSQTLGYDARTGQFVDMISAGVGSGEGRAGRLARPASVAGLLITTEAMVIVDPNKEAPAMLGVHGAMGERTDHQLGRPRTAACRSSTVR